MDPNTVIVILATHLICSGGLFHLIGRRMPPRSGLELWAAGAVVFGLAYVGRLAAGLNGSSAWVVLLDAAMVFAALLFVSGLRRFLGGAPLGRATLVAAVAGFAAAQGIALAVGGAAGRHALLNLCLGLIYGLLALESLRERGRQAEVLRRPLLLLGAVMGVLALLTLARAAVVAHSGVAQLYRGAFAQVYYAYASLAAVLLGLNLLWLVFARLNAQLAELASRDALTRVLNRNGLDEVVARHFAAREMRPVTLLEVDIDHFKRINDSRGHAAGDRMLRAVAETLSARLRGSDFLARVGGEEFLVGCVGTDADAAPALAQRLCEAVRALEVADARAPLRCTVSIGVSRPCTQRSGWEQAWGEADRALYAAKAAGRDRVVAFAAIGQHLR